MKRKILWILFIIPFFGMAQNTDELVVTTDQDQVEDISESKKQPDENAGQEIIKPECVSGDCQNGKGEMKFNTGIYSGGWKDGLRNGQGTYTWNNGDVYTGSWSDDSRHGYGEYVWKDGSIYKGNYSAGVRSGYGIYYYTDGRIYEGTWQNNLKHGIANFYYKESVNIGGKYANNEYVTGTGITQENYKYKPKN